MHQALAEVQGEAEVEAEMRVTCIYLILSLTECVRLTGPVSRFLASRLRFSTCATSDPSLDNTTLPSAPSKSQGLVSLV